MHDDHSHDHESHFESLENHPHKYLDSNLVQSHAGDHDHFDPEDELLEDNPLWQRDNVQLWSVGIDIGSAGTQIVFSRMHLQRQSVELSSRYIVVHRETLYESPVCLTPYRSETEIDDQALGTLVDDAYYAAGVSPKEIDTGVVILTGEALRRENSARIASILSEKCGDLVCATAGHHMEARLAAYGSGAARISFDHQSTVLNIDIGGGTTKLSILKNGVLLETAAIHIGGRLVAINDKMTLVRLDPAGKTHARRAGFDWHLGTQVSPTELGQVAECMASTLQRLLTQANPPQADQELYLTDPIPNDIMNQVTEVIFSGGVAEFFYHREAHDYGDLGRFLGEALRIRSDDGRLPWALLSESQGIRATALGASEYTTQLSGNTCYVADSNNLLPLRNVQVIQPNFEFSGLFDAHALGLSIAKHLKEFEADHAEDPAVLAIHWTGAPEYRRLRNLAEGIALGFAHKIELSQPIYVVLDADIALTLGNILREDLKIMSAVLIIDGVTLADFDYVDIGRVRQPSNTLPVTIKSLIFKDRLDGPRPEKIHHSEAKKSQP